MVSAAQIWGWLGEVPDPEIPVLSLVDLGVIRDVVVEDDAVVVAVTPTYSGCPATAIINLDIEAALRAHGVEKLRLERRLSPPWTTDWMSAAAHEKLRAYGIAPPTRQVDCPRCGSDQVRRVSAFGSTPCQAHYVCEDCREPFDRFKCL